MNTAAWTRESEQKFQVSRVKLDVQPVQAQISGCGAAALPRMKPHLPPLTSSSP